MAKEFQSPTYGSLSFLQVRKKVLAFMNADSLAKYQLVIGTDSQAKNEQTDFVIAIIVHRIGRGGIYFWQRRIEKKTYVLRQRIYQEATMSLEMAEEFLEITKDDGINRFDVEIHVDIGKFGKTREMINELTGMVRGSGFRCQIKPESYGASKVADRYT